MHYIVREGEVVIVDEFTGRTMPGRRWGEGLHQAVEAKEGLQPGRENETLASISYQVGRGSVGLKSVQSHAHRVLFTS